MIASEALDRLSDNNVTLAQDRQYLERTTCNVD
jgi:hypothetical protein